MKDQEIEIGCKAENMFCNIWCFCPKVLKFERRPPWDTLLDISLTPGQTSPFYGQTLCLLQILSKPFIKNACTLYSPAHSGMPAYLPIVWAWAAPACFPGCRLKVIVTRSKASVTRSRLLSQDQRLLAQDQRFCHKTKGSVTRAKTTEQTKYEKILVRRTNISITT